MTITLGTVSGMTKGDGGTTLNDSPAKIAMGYLEKRTFID